MRLRPFFLYFVWIAFFLFAGLCGCNTELKRARQSVLKEDYLQAAALYEKVIQKDPENDPALRELTQLYCGGKINNNFKCLGTSRKLHNRFSQDEKVSEWYKKALFENAVDTFLSGELKRSTKYLELYKNLDPKNGIVLFMLADIIFRSNRKPPQNEKELAKALEIYQASLNASKPTDMFALSSRTQKEIVHWEAYMRSATIHEFSIKEKWAAWMKANAKRTKSRKKRRRRRGATKMKTAEDNYFQPDPVLFEKAVKALKAAGTFSAKHPNPYKRALPFTQLGIFYGKYKGDYGTALTWLKKAEKWKQDDPTVLGNMKMIYDRLAEFAEKAGNKEKQRAFKKKYEQYASKFDSLNGQR